MRQGGNDRDHDKEARGVGNAEVGILIGLFSLPGVVLSLPGGLLGQIIGDRRLVLAGLVLMTLGSPWSRQGSCLASRWSCSSGPWQLGGAAAQWFTRPDSVVALGLLPFGVALTLLPYASPLPSLVVIGVFVGLPAAILVAAPTIVLTERSRSPGLGLFYTWYYAGMALLPGMAGWLQDRLGRAAAVDFAAAAVLTALVSYLGFRTVASVPGLSRRRRSCRRAP